MPNKDESFYTGHRERLRAKYLAGQLADYEKLELLLSYPIPRRDVRPLARALMARYKNIPNILATPASELRNFRGLGESTLVFFQLLYDVSLMQYESVLSSQPIFHDPRTLGNYCRMLVANKNVEEFHVLYLDGTHRLIDSFCHAVGSISYSPIVPRDIVTRAVQMGAHSVVLLHNHPKRTPYFSADDYIITQHIIDGLAVVDIVVIDHLLMVGGIIHCMNQNGFSFTNTLTSQTLPKGKDSTILQVFPG